MLSRILFATDLSPASDLAIECIAGWKKLGLRRVVVAHVHNIRNSGGLEAALLRDHEPKLERQAGRLREAGLFASWRFEIGIPYLEVDRIASEEGCEAVVLGSHGTSWVREVWLGSIADAILRHASLPALVIKINRLAELPQGECSGVCGGMFGRILLATDFSPEAGEAATVVERLCRQHRPRLRVVHVREHHPLLELVAADRLEALTERARDRLRQLAAAFESAGAAETSVELIGGHPTRAILEVVERWEPTLVAISRTGRGGRPRIGATAHDVARESPVPVLVVPARKGPPA